MITRSSENWRSLPGNFDKLNTFQKFPSTNDFGIPILEPVFAEPVNLIPYNHRVRSEMGYKDLAIHFFLDDYRFESVWSHPVKTLERISRADFVLTPDFSLFSDWPVALQLYNTYRNRWLGAYWQNQGIQVIPTVSWSDERSYDFAFLGIQRGSTVAISTQGIRTEEEKELFQRGYDEMLGMINPRNVLVYGKMFENLKDWCPFKEYKTYFASLKDLRK